MTWELSGFSAGMVLARVATLRRMIAAVSAEMDRIEADTRAWQRKTQAEQAYPPRLRRE